MSCKDCEEIQARIQNGEGGSAYIRLTNAFVLIGACDRHFKQVRDMLKERVQYYTQSGNCVCGGDDER